MSDRKLYLECQCHNMSHLVGVHYWSDAEPELYITTLHSHYLPWYRRIGPALRYLLGRTSAEYESTLVGATDAEALAEMAAQCARDWKQWAADHGIKS